MVHLRYLFFCGMLPITAILLLPRLKEAEGALSIHPRYAYPAVAAEIHFRKAGEGWDDHMTFSVPPEAPTCREGGIRKVEAFRHQMQASTPRVQLCALRAVVPPTRLCLHNDTSPSASFFSQPGDTCLYSRQAFLDFCETHTSNYCLVDLFGQPR